MSDDEYCEKDFENFCRHENYLRNKERIRKYQEKNKDKLKEYSKKYYQENKERLNEISKTYDSKTEMWKCECGAYILKRGKKKHLQSKKHIEKTIQV